MPARKPKESYNQEVIQHPMMYKTMKSPRAQEIRNVVLDGQYLLGKENDKYVCKNIFDEMVDSYTQTKLIENHSYDIPDNIATFNNTEITFTNSSLMDVLDTERRIYGSCISIISAGPAKHILNMMALGEEDWDSSFGKHSVALAACSKYYNEFYEGYKANNKRGYYDDKILVAKQVPVIYKPDYTPLHHPYLVDYYVMPAISKTKICKYGYSNTEKLNNIMKERMRNLLKAVAVNSTSKNGYKVLVLNPFGCNMGNKLEDISHIWYQLLEEEGYKKYFSKIIFSASIKEFGLTSDVMQKSYR